MKKRKFYYNPHSCSYEPVRLQASTLIARLLFAVFVIGLSVLGTVAIYQWSIGQYVEKSSTQEENAILKLQYELMSNEIVQLEEHLKKLQLQDDEIYRTIFEAQPLASNLRQAGVGGSERYVELADLDKDLSDFIMDLRSRVDRMKKQVIVQTNSFDKVLRLAKEKNLKHASIPAIQPISNKELYRLSSGYGKRIDPIYKTEKMHWGIDFSAPRGTPVYATGAGRIHIIERRDGYGKRIVLNHGFGYESLYAHLSSFNVREGQYVERGDAIGFVGSTGKSTSPHLHYEVKHNNKRINPIHYFFQDLDEQDYLRLLERASIKNQSLE